MKPVQFPARKYSKIQLLDTKNKEKPWTHNITVITITLHFIVFPGTLEGGGIVDAFGPRRGWVDELLGAAQRPPPHG